MKHSSKTKQIFLATIILVIVVSVAYIILLLKLKEKNNNVFALTNEVDVVLQKEIKLRSVKSLIKDTAKEREELDSRFVADDNIVNFIEIIEDLGADSGAEVEIISVSVSDINKEITNKSDIGEFLNLDFKIEGRFAQVFHFLSMLEKLPFNIDILRANLEKISNETKNADSWNGFFSIAVVKLK